MDKKTSQTWLNRLYWVRDIFVGWYFKRMTRDDFKWFAKTPWRMWLFWQLGMRYIFDEEDYAQSPDETWERRGGDCEDMAWFCRDHLRFLGYEAEMFRAEWDKPTEQGIKAHIVCIFRPDSNVRTSNYYNGWSYMGTNEYRPGSHDWAEIAKNIVGNKGLDSYGSVGIECHKIRYISTRFLR